MSKDPVLVLGAGCAGLSAAWRLRAKGRPVVVVEAEDHPGGLAGGIRIAGNTYEYGPHIFHTTDPEILSDVKSIMGADLLPYKRTIKIKFLGNYFRFPLSIKDVLFKLPPLTVLKAGLSFAFRFVQGALVKPEVETSETVLRRYYGDVLYKIFFKDYIERVWGISPAEFSPSFAKERIPRFNILEWGEKLRESLGQKLGRVKTEGYVERLEGELYTTRRGFSMITERMAQRLVEGGAPILYKTRVTGIRREGRRVTGVEVDGPEGKRTLPCSAVVNTLPINEAVKLFKPGLGEPVEDAARALRFRAIVFVGIKVKRSPVLMASFMYFREHSFNRITDLSYFGFDIEPKGSTLLVAEVTCNPDRDRIWLDEDMAKEAVLDDLERERILRREEVEEVHVFRARHAHPMYTLGYEKALATAVDAIEALDNAETCGRQGRFQYVNTHVAMKMGYEAADRLLRRLPV